VDAADHTLWRSTAFVRVRRIGGADWACRASLLFERLESTASAGSDAYAAYARFGAGGRNGLMLIDALDSDSGRMTVVARGLTSGHQYAFSARQGSCAALGTPVIGFNSLNTPDKSASDILKAVPPLQEPLLSATVMTISDSTLQERWGCRPSVLVALLLP